MFDFPLSKCGANNYRKSSIKRRGAYSKLDFFDAALNRGRRLFEGGAYSKTNEKLKRVGHVPIECSSLLDYFLKADSANKLIATVEGKRKREIGLVVPGKFICCTKQLRQANILYRELMEKKTKYSHFEIN